MPPSCSESSLSTPFWSRAECPFSFPPRTLFFWARTGAHELPFECSLVCVEGIPSSSPARERSERKMIWSRTDQYRQMPPSQGDIKPASDLDQANLLRRRIEPDGFSRKSPSCARSSKFVFGSECMRKWFDLAVVVSSRKAPPTMVGPCSPLDICTLL